MPQLTDTKGFLQTVISLPHLAPETPHAPCLAEISEAVRRRAALSSALDPLPEPHASTHKLLSGPILADYIGGNAERFRYIAPLTFWLWTGNATQAAQENTAREPGNAYVRSVQAQVSGFCFFAAAQLPKERARLARLFEAEKRQRANRALDRGELRDLLDAYCDSTCRAGGGTGRTIDVELAKVRARDCLGCSIRAGVFGGAGWGG